jgi:hypothetical protein
LIGVPDLEKAAEDAITKGRESWPRKGRLYVSDLSVALPPDRGGTCPLQLWHKLRDAPLNPPSPGTQLMFQAGDNMHEMFVEWLKAELPGQGWEVVAVEEKVRLADDVGARLDIEIVNKDDETIVVDFKTKRGGAFAYLDEDRIQGNVLQVQCYIEARAREGKNVIGGLLLYIDREGSNFVRQYPPPGEPPILPDPERVAEALAVGRSIRDNDRPPPPLSPKLRIKRNKGPDALYLDLPWQAQWCALKQCPCSKQLPDCVRSKLGRNGVLVGHLDGTKLKIKGEFADVAPVILELLKKETQ